MDRVAFFIDGPNLRPTVDIARLIERLLGGRTIGKSTYYHSEERKPELLTRFSDLLQSFQLEIRRVPRARKKYERVDIELSVDLVDYAHKDLFDIALIVSGDSDFTYPIRKLYEQHKPVEIAGFPESMSATMKASATRFHSLDAFFREVRLR